jgi:hypothetical protein
MCDLSNDIDLPLRPSTSTSSGEYNDLVLGSPNDSKMLIDFVYRKVLYRMEMASIYQESTIVVG